MKRSILWSILSVVLVGAVAVFAAEDVSWGELKATTTVSANAAAKSVNSNACWGVATQLFAQLGEMGQHSSEQPTPRLGLRNLARLLAEAGIIPDDSMTSLAEFVAANTFDENNEPLDISACQ